MRGCGSGAGDGRLPGLKIQWAWSMAPPVAWLAGADLIISWLVDKQLWKSNQADAAASKTWFFSPVGNGFSLLFSSDFLFFTPYFLFSVFCFITICCCFIFCFLTFCCSFLYSWGGLFTFTIIFRFSDFFMFSFILLSFPPPFSAFLFYFYVSVCLFFVPFPIFPEFCFSPYFPPKFSVFSPGFVLFSS